VTRPIPVPDATTEPAAYVRALLDTLGDLDPISTYAETPHLVAEICRPLPEEIWYRSPAAGEWAVNEIVGHLLDVDIVYGFRFRLNLTADNPMYPGYDEKAWAALPKPPPTELISAFEALRSANVALLRGIGPADKRRSGVHAEQGPEDVDLMIRKIAGHDLAHLDQLRRAAAQ
jgi:hypothetical protein